MSMLKFKLLDEKCQAEQMLGGYIKAHENIFKSVVGGETCYSDALGGCTQNGGPARRSLTGWRHWQIRYETMRMCLW